MNIGNWHTSFDDFGFEMIKSNLLLVEAAIKPILRLI